MRVSIVGTGNSGSAVVMRAVETLGPCDISVASHRPESAQAAVLDVASAFPDRSARVRVCSVCEAGGADVIALCAGAQIAKGQTATDAMSANMVIVGSLIADLNVRPDAVVIVIASPVDDITAYAQVVSGLPATRVVGFGGDLDVARLRFALLRRGLVPSAVSIVGEHGGKAIPVYPGEADYEVVADEVRTQISRVTKAAGPPRNLATGTLLTALIRSIIDDAGVVHHVCGHHPDLGVHLTWPFVVGRQGLGTPIACDLAPLARRDLNALLPSRAAVRDRIVRA